MTGEPDHVKTRLSFRQDVHPPVLEPFDPGDTSQYPDFLDCGRALFLAAEQNNPKWGVVVDARVDHRLVPLLEDMKRKHDAREENDVRERKQGDFDVIASGHNDRITLREEDSGLLHELSWEAVRGQGYTPVPRLVR